MKSQQNGRFLEGAILPSLLKFAGPVLLAMILQALYGAVDLWAVGRFAKTADISAVSTGSQTMQIVTGPSLSSSTFMSAPNSPVLTGEPIAEESDWQKYS